MMHGKIVKGIAGFYYVHVEGQGTLECKAKGVFRKQNVKPLVGDDVEVSWVEKEKQTGNIIRICPRKNALLRPAVANVDQAVIIFSLSFPKPNLNLLDRFLLMMQTQKIPTLVCLNKIDTAEEMQTDKLVNHCQGSGSGVCLLSAHSGAGLEEFLQRLKGKTSVLAGPSGVGKSSLLNALFPEIVMETGEISQKIKRGKHTTRHSELFALDEATYLMDTPGFTSFSLPMISKEELREYYPDFAPYEGTCRFQGCIHINEPDCAVKEAVERMEISQSRYENYKQFYDEISQRRDYL